LRKWQSRSLINLAAAPRYMHLVIDSTTQAKPLSFIKGALFQWVNAKAWVVATGALAAFTTAGMSFYSQNLTIALTFFVVSFPCVGIWLCFGSMLKHLLKNERNRQWFNYAMSGLLVLSFVPVIKEIADILV